MTRKSRPRTAEVPRLALDMADVAAAFGVGKAAIYELVESQTLRTIVVGRRRLATIAACEDCLIKLEKQPVPLPSTLPNNRRQRKNGIRHRNGNGNGHR